MGTSARLAEPHAKHRGERGRLGDEHAALRRVATLVAAGAPPAEVFEAVSAEVAALIDADGSALLRYETEGTVTAVSGWTAEGGVGHLGIRFPLEGTVSGLIFETGAPARMDSYAEVPGEGAEAAREIGTRSSVGAPITVDGRLWGVLAVTSKSETRLPPGTEFRLAEFAELFATAIANSEAHERLEQLADEQAALRRVATLVAAGSPPAEVFEAVSAEVAALMGADGSALTRYDEDGTVTAVSGWTTEGGYTYVGRRYRLEGTVSGLIFETGAPARVDNYANAPGEAPVAAREMGWRSSVGAPITVGGHPWGVLAVTSKSETRLPPGTEHRLAEFAELFATAIANSEAHERLAQLADEQAALRRVATLVAEGAAPQRVFDAVRDEVARMFDAPISWLMRYDDTSGTVSLLATSDGFLGPVGRTWTVEGDDSATAQVCRTGLPVRVDYANPVQGAIAGAARAEGGQSAVAVPVVVEGTLWGVVAVGTRELEPLPADLEDRLAKFTQLLATAIANSQAHEQLERLADEQAALRRVATLVAEGATPHCVFDAVRHEVARMFNAPLSGLLRYDGNGTVTQLAASDDYPGPVEMSWSVEGDSSAVAQVCRTGLPARADYTQAPRGSIAATARDEGTRSAVAVPIVVDGALWGVMAVGTREADPLPADLEDRLAKFTELLATAIANSQAHEQLAQLADEQAALRRVATLVAEGATTHCVFDAVRHEVAQMFHAPLSVLMRYDESSAAATLVATDDGFLGPIGRSWSVEGDNSAIARACRTGRPARSDYSRPLEGPMPDAARSVGARSAVAVPVLVDGTLWGVMAVGSREPEPLPPDFEARLAKFTELLATAIANAESRAELDASRARIVATADATRRRIERDLHDGAQQRLVSLALEVRAAQANAPKQMSRHREDLSHVAEGLTSVLGDLREIALGIHPAILAEGGLGPAVKTLAHRSPIPVELDVRDDRRLAESVEVAAYYVVSEALTNAAKHSGASRVTVEVEVHGSALRVTVCDDGVGGADPAQGSGLLGLKDRAEAIGGTLTLESRQGVGTCLIAEVPLASSM
ncbi:MAG TPA: GAF domain-containing protein [Gaiellaceae bacterium]|jgi:GAF domain-containing protein